VRLYLCQYVLFHLMQENKHVCFITKLSVANTFQYWNWHFVPQPEYFLLSTTVTSHYEWSLRTEDIILIRKKKKKKLSYKAKSWLIGKDSDAGRDWGQEEKGTTEDEMAGWHHWLDGHESEWTPGVGDGQGGLACCNSWGRKESDMTERLIWSDLILGKEMDCPRLLN